MDATELTTLEAGGRCAHNPQNFYTVFVLDDGQEETPVLCEYPGLVVGVLRVAGNVQHGMADSSELSVGGTAGG